MISQTTAHLNLVQNFKPFSWKIKKLRPRAQIFCVSTRRPRKPTTLECPGGIGDWRVRNDRRYDGSNNSNSSSQINKKCSLAVFLNVSFLIFILISCLWEKIDSSNFSDSEQIDYFRFFFFFWTLRKKSIFKVRN